MPSSPIFQRLIKRLTSEKPEDQLAARIIIISMQERAVPQLIDEYYAGVNDAGAIAILDLLGQIGGPAALNMLREVVRLEKQNVPIRVTAAQALMRNADTLSPKERRALEKYLRAHAPQEQEDE